MTRAAAPGPSAVPMRLLMGSLVAVSYAAGFGIDQMIAKAVDDALEGAPRKVKRTDKGLEEIISRAARSVSVHHWGKKPVMTAMITRLEDE